MGLERWRPRADYTKQEQVLRHRLPRTGRLFGFLRDCRRELFDDELQAELESMYRDGSAEHEPVPPRCWRWRSFCKHMKACPTPRR